MHLIFLFPFFIFIELTIYFKWFARACHMMQEEVVDTFSEGEWPYK